MFIVNPPLFAPLDPSLDAPYGLRFRSQGKGTRHFEYAFPTPEFWKAWHSDRAEMEKLFKLHRQQGKWWVIVKKS